MCVRRGERLTDEEFIEHMRLTNQRCAAIHEDGTFAPARGVVGEVLRLVQIIKERSDAKPIADEHCAAFSRATEEKFGRYLDAHGLPVCPLLPGFTPSDVRLRFLLAHLEEDARSKPTLKGEADLTGYPYTIKAFDTVRGVEYAYKAMSREGAIALCETLNVARFDSVKATKETQTITVWEDGKTVNTGL